MRASKGVRQRSHFTEIVLPAMSEPHLRADEEDGAEQRDHDNGARDGAQRNAATVGRVAALTVEAVLFGRVQFRIEARRVARHFAFEAPRLLRAAGPTGRRRGW